MASLLLAAGAVGWTLKKRSGGARPVDALPPGKKPEVEVMVPVRAVALTGSGTAKSPKPGVRARLFRRLPGIRESACSPAGGTAASHAAEP
ncbi:hypothetical protein EMIHUDRAFT_251337 [Emiliania huxleyi CCMP1516]|uniref:Uncharacterized protein n=2 Tax=Emiliania huxleyi TaxID=2903 RepID=A0A0D3I7M6_EMIH1|nr:hypothetical protein EMIHUDRAFT_198646 [Emiliania huxleyi CCMP1516]XP_005792350.1 hypothetical protein EMIHUDRAFT_251337 [Emiliania huxleyi CCMP1516]EOD07261.1 hypothetical protein EMIHUDRAFT_198646 [Emiliania huxleyi CCMP1516]EOD39921.1 hypothetical protein EMIHUDRAFT_251337 [Emiliania huxleyi CCMP1516]|eukprot:XP_005759690.1 hypothetical protein EMIHUDRAFT_198646 [Emiliania huxleyi CCMP1516]